jgi:hypothetical protein
MCLYELALIRDQNGSLAGSETVQNNELGREHGSSTLSLPFCAAASYPVTEIFIIWDITPCIPVENQ